MLVNKITTKRLSQFDDGMRAWQLLDRPIGTQLTYDDSRNCVEYSTTEECVKGVEARGLERTAVMEAGLATAIAAEEQEIQQRGGLVSDEEMEPVGKKKKRKKK